MDIKEIKKELLAAVTLIEDYEQYGMSIDRDAAIDKIRIAYQALRFDDGCQLPAAPVAAEMADTETEVGQTETEQDVPEVEVEFIMPEPEEYEPEVDETDTQDEEPEELKDELVEEPVEEPEEVIYIAEDDDADDAEVDNEADVVEAEPEEMFEKPQPEIESEVVAEPEPAEEPQPKVGGLSEPVVEPKIVEPEPIVVPKFDEQPEPEVKVEEPEAEESKVEQLAESEVVAGGGVVEQSLFGDSEQWSRPKPRVRRRLIALYDDDSAVVAQPKATQSPSEPVVSEPEQPSVPKMETVADVVAEGVAPKILGEVVESVPTLGDTIVAAPSVGESTAVESLRKAITVGNRFMLVRDLFDGDEALYERTISLLDEMDSLDDCIIYIAENFVWRPSSEGAKLVIDLLQRKFR